MVEKASPMPLYMLDYQLPFLINFQYGSTRIFICDCSLLPYGLCKIINSSTYINLTILSATNPWWATISRAAWSFLVHSFSFAPPKLDESTSCPRKGPPCSSLVHILKVKRSWTLLTPVQPQVLNQAASQHICDCNFILCYYMRLIVNYK